MVFRWTHWFNHSLIDLRLWMRPSEAMWTVYRYHYFLPSSRSIWCGVPVGRVWVSEPPSPHPGIFSIIYLYYVQFLKDWFISMFNRHHFFRKNTWHPFQSENINSSHRIPPSLSFNTAFVNAIYPITFIIQPYESSLYTGKYEYYIKLVLF